MEVKFNHEINERGLYAATKYFKGTTIFTLSGEEYDHPTRESIHVGNNRHVYDKYGIFMNHSFTPTTYINKYDVVALVDIDIGTELTFNYNENEINMANPFVSNDILVSGKIC